MAHHLKSRTGYFRCLHCSRSDFDSVGALLRHIRKRKHGYHEKLKSTIQEFLADNNLEGKNLFDIIHDDDLALSRNVRQTAEDLVVSRACLVHHREAVASG